MSIPADLLSRLRDLPAGEVPGDVHEEIKRMLAACWDDLDGSNVEAMADYKVQRGEDLVWDPPRLRFRVERHGRTALGSTRADVQEWTVDLEAREASCEVVGYRQLRPRSASWGAQEARDAAIEVSTMIVRGIQDHRLRWTNPNKVQLVMDHVIPGYKRSPKRTKEGRRDRFYAALAHELQNTPWRIVSYNYVLRVDE